MKICFIASVPVQPTSGAFKKIISQANRWAKMGNDVYLILLTKQSDILSLEKEALKVNIIKIRLKTHFQRFLDFRYLLREVENINPDIVYMRFDTVFYPDIAAVGLHYPLVFEINSDDITEFKLMFGRFKYLYHLCTRNFLIRLANGFISVSNELASKFSKSKKEIQVIPNSIELDKYKALPPNNDSVTRLVFIGSSNQPWHGVDKILSLAKLKPQWEFLIIGLKEVQNDHKLKNVKLFGPLTSKSYASLLQRSDVAIGTLALHRKQINEASPLKTLEYLAFGLPVIIAYEDTNFPDDKPFILNLPNIENNIKPYIDDIEKFVLFWKGKRVPRSEIEHIDMQNRERVRLDFFANIVANAKRRPKKKI